MTITAWSCPSPAGSTQRTVSWIGSEKRRNSVGAAVCDGATVGDLLGFAEGAEVGRCVGTAVGEAVGDADGACVGLRDGVAVGLRVGFVPRVGFFVGMDG